MPEAPKLPTAPYGAMTRFACFVYYANVVTVNVVTANAMLFHLYSSERFIHIGPKCIQFQSQIDPSFSKKHSEKRFCYDHPRYDHICAVWKTSPERERNSKSRATG